MLNSNDAGDKANPQKMNSMKEGDSDPYLYTTKRMVRQMKSNNKFN